MHLTIAFGLFIHRKSMQLANIVLSPWLPQQQLEQATEIASTFVVRDFVASESESESEIEIGLVSCSFASSTTTATAICRDGRAVRCLRCRRHRRRRCPSIVDRDRCCRAATAIDRPSANALRRLCRFYRHHDVDLDQRCHDPSGRGSICRHRRRDYHAAARHSVEKTTTMTCIRDPFAHHCSAPCRSASIRHLSRLDHRDRLFSFRVRCASSHSLVVPIEPVVIVLFHDELVRVADRCLRLRLRFVSTLLSLIQQQRRCSLSIRPSFSLSF